MSALDEYFAKVNRGSQKASSVSASGEKPASSMDAYFAKAGKPTRTNPLNLYTEALKASQGQTTMKTPYADAAAQIKRGNNAAKGTSVVFNSVYGKADDRESSAGSGKYADILKASDYTELSKSGESKRKLFGDARYDYINNIGNFRAQSDVQQAQGRGQDYGKYAFMTDEEVGVYNYLYATQGKKAANSYLSDLEPELDKQWYTGTNRATTEALGKNAATRTLASAATVAAQPTRTVTSMIAMADDAIRTAKGQKINPYSKWRQASNITQDLRSDTSQHIEETNPGMGGKVGSFVYNTAMSAADSYMNSLVARGFGEVAGLSGKDLMKATNILGSALMSSEVASLSTAEGKEKGYSNAGAMSLGLTRGAVEFMSEMLGGEWVIKNIKANPLNSVKSMALNMIPEGLEEVMSDAMNGAVNLAVDALFGTEESGIPKMLEYYRNSGTPWQKSHPELATVLAILGQESLSFLGGSLATFGTSAVQTYNMRTSINTTAERLDTTPQNVVQLMQSMETEDPGVVYALAELTDAENADDLRQKIGTKEDMKRAAAYLEEQMQAGGRSEKRESNYTAETQNAPVGVQRAQTAINQTLEANPSDRFAATSPIMGGKGEGGSQNMKGEFGNGQSTYHGEEGGTAYVGARGQAAEGAEGGLQALAGGRAQVRRGVGADAQADLRQVTPAQLGIKNGGTEAVTVVDAQQLGGEAKSAYDTVARRGMEPVAVRGAIQVGNGYANAYTESMKVYFRVDAVDSNGNAISPEQLVQHELFHNYISEEGLRASDEVIRESMTAEEYDAMRDAYKADYAGVYDFANMSVDEIERLLTEEIAADAYAGLNFFSVDTPVQEAVRAEAKRNAPAQRTEAQRETTGPPENKKAPRFSLNVYSEQQKENWNRSKKIVVYENAEQLKNFVEKAKSDKNYVSKIYFGTVDGLLAEEIMNETGYDFQGKNVTLRADNVRKIFKDHGAESTEAPRGQRPITADDFGKIPEVIGNPDSISESDYFGRPAAEFKKTIDNSRITVFAVDSGGSSLDLYVQTMYAGRKKGSIADTANASALTQTPVAPAGTASFVEAESGPVQGATASGRLVEPTDTASMSSIRSDAGNSQEKSSGRASIVVLPDGKKYVQADRQVIFGNDPNSWADQIEGYINRKIRNGEDVILTTDSGDVLKITKDTAGKASFRNYVTDESGRRRPMTDSEYETKLNAEAHIDELAKVSERVNKNARPDETSTDGRPIHGRFAENGWLYREAWFQDFDNQYYKVTLSIADGNNGVVVYNVGKMEKRTSPARKHGSSDSVTETGAQQGKSSSTVTIRQTEGNGQEKSSGGAGVEVENRNTEMSEEDARRERLRKLQEADRKELDRLTKRDDTLHQINRENGRPAPNKGSGEVYRELMSKGKSEVLTPISMDNPRTLSFKITMDTNVLGVATATVMHNGHQIYKETGPIKEYVARDAAEFVDVQANKNFSQENFERAKQLEAEKTSDEDARIAELFGDSEELAKQELTDKTVESLTEKGQVDKAEEYAARATIAGTTEKVIPEVLKAERNYREEIEKIASGAMRMFVNAGDTVRRIAKATKSKSLEGYYFNAGAYSQRAGNWIAKGGARTDIDGHKTGASLADTLAPMRKDAAKYRDFQLYLLHMHNVDRMKYDNSEELQQIKDELIRVKERYPQLKELSAQELARVASDAADDPITRAEAHEMYIEAHQGKNPRIGTVNMAAAYIQELQKQRAIVEKQGLKPVFGYDVTADDSQTAAMLLESKNPEFKEWAKEVYKYSDDLIRYRVEAGLITREFADALKKRYPHYIPTFREEGTNSKKARSARRNGGIVVSNAIGRAVGSDGVLLPLHTALSRKTVSTMRNAGLNQFGLALVREYDGNKKAAEKYIWNVAESEYTPTEAAIESDEDYKPVFENIFSVKENGKAYDITMDEGLTAAMKAFEPDKFANYGAAKAMKKLNDLFKALCTGYNPFFMIRNGVRDWQDAGFYSTDWKTWEKMYWSAWNQIAKNGEIWQQYKALGGSYASMLDYTTGMVKEPKNALGKAAARYERLGQAIEAAPRLAEFMTILANKGGSKTVNGVKTGQFTQSDLMEAMLGAADITTNFARGGSVTKALNRYLVPFLNPSVQGFDKFVRNATDIVQRRDVKAAASLILKAALINLPPLLLNGLMHGDDDEWDDIPANTKANYYLINFGNGIWLKIPKGRAIAVLSTAAVYGKEKLDGEDVKFSDVFEVIKSNIAPTDIFNQNIATAWTQTKLTNPDNPGTTWYGGNIESDRLQNYRPGERYDEKTDELSKWIGKTFNLSPKKINYLLDQYSGVIGDILLPLMTPATSAASKLLAAPMAAFTIDTTSTNKTTGEYYDLLDDLKYDANDGDVGAGITRKYVSHAGDEVNDYYAQIRELQNDKNLSDGEKNRLVRALKKQLIERQKEIITQAEPYREAVDKYLKAHPELSTDNDAAIAEYAEQYEITEDQAESRMDAIVYREANREVFGAEYALRTYNADVYDKARTAYAKGVSYETYYDYYFATKEMHADKDENGKSISGSKKAKVVEYINSLDIPAEQKDALYVAAGYTEKSARYQKWNGGSGGSGGRRGSGKRTTLKAPAPKAGKIIIPEAGSTAKSGSTSKTAKASGNVIADFTQKVSGTDIRKAATQAKRKALKVGNRTVYVEEGSPIDYFLKYGKLPSTK